MFKNIISPVQAWLLSKGQCVGCGTTLSSGTKTAARLKDHDQVTCKCGRIFMYNQKTKTYRRALFDEVK